MSYGLDAFYAFPLLQVRKPVERQQVMCLMSSVFQFKLLNLGILLLLM